MTWLWSVLADFFLDKLWGAFREWQAARNARKDAKRQTQLKEHEKARRARNAAKDSPDDLDDDNFLDRMRRRDGDWRS